ncbi:MAG: sugar transporter [Pseudomonadota bacterium]
MEQRAAPLPALSPDLVARVRSTPFRHRRRLVAVAGPPASGKTTLAAALAQALGAAAAVPMDGFHLDNRVLDDRALRPRKGAPETFDAAGFCALVARLREEDEVVYPIFDRAQDQAIAGACVVGPDCETVVLEGNYLLFREAPWATLAPLWDVSIWVETPLETVRARCRARWLAHGHSTDAARARADTNDVPNAQRVIGGKLPADFAVGMDWTLRPE